MMRAFLIVTAGVGTAVGWLVAGALRVVAGWSLAFVCGTAIACLFVGEVYDTLISK